VAAICRAAVTTLMSIIADEEIPDREVLFAPDLIVRGSTAQVPHPTTVG
jgi:transcriptional regulator, LacI family